MGHRIDTFIRRQVAGYCAHGKETAGSTKCGEFLDYLRNCYLLKKDPVRRKKLLTLGMQRETPVDVGVQVVVETVPTKSKLKLLDKFSGSTHSIKFHAHMLRGTAVCTMDLWVFTLITTTGLFGRFGRTCCFKLQGNYVWLRVLQLNQIQ
jgi:hypothetical protein